MRDVKKIVPTEVLRLVVLAVLLLPACQDVVEHHDVATVVATPPETVVARVNGRPIGAAELREEMRRDSKSADEAMQALIERELLVEKALAAGKGDETVPVKAAAARVLLEDEIEAKVGPKDADAALVEAHEKAHRAKMTVPEGYEASAITIYVPVEVDGKKPEGEDLERWTELARAEAERVKQWWSDEPTADRLKTFDPATLPHPIGASARPTLTVASSVEVGQTHLPEGWTPNDALFSLAASLKDGEVGLIQLGQAFFVLARHRKIERAVPTDAEVKAKAVEDAVRDQRAKRLEEFLEELRSKYSVDLYPEVIREAAEGAESNP